MSLIGVKTSKKAEQKRHFLPEKRHSDPAKDRFRQKKTDSGRVPGVHARGVHARGVHASDEPFSVPRSTCQSAHLALRAVRLGGFRIVLFPGFQMSGTSRFNGLRGITTSVCQAKSLFPRRNEKYSSGQKMSFRR